MVAVRNKLNEEPIKEYCVNPGLQLQNTMCIAKHGRVPTANKRGESKKEWNIEYLRTRVVKGLVRASLKTSLD